MNINTAIAVSIAAIFLGLGIAAAGGASSETIGTIGVFGFFLGLGLVTRLDREVK
jgi:hypothetical protein